MAIDPSPVGESPSELVIELKRGRDGPDVLSCVRPDGSRSWSRLHPFFPLHDLTHYAVERTLAFRGAFFGLLASGWEIDDFAKPGSSERMGNEALLAESIVGIFDLERGQGAHFTADEFNEALALALREHQQLAFREIEASELNAVRAWRGELSARWGEVKPGDVFRLSFQPESLEGSRH